IVASEHWESVRSHISRDGQIFDLAKADTTYQSLRLSLLGQHQVANATVVVATLDLLREQGVTWDEAALREGFSDVIWPARVEVLQKNPIVIADGAHTYASATALIDTINEIMPKGWSCSYLILGFSSNKDISSLLNVFAHFADVIILTRAEHPRAADPLKLAAHPAFSTRQAPIVIPKVADAMQLAQAQAGSNDLIIATGSLFVAAEARASMGRDNLLSKEKPWTLDQFFKLISSKISK
ncbi:MAG: glutamate ligase domain-containing protein, partial [Ardenticatenaceae bacterium]